MPSCFHFSPFKKKKKQDLNENSQKYLESSSKNLQCPPLSSFIVELPWWPGQGEGHVVWQKGATFTCWPHTVPHKWRREERGKRKQNCTRGNGDPLLACFVFFFFLGSTKNSLFQILTPNCFSSSRYLCPILALKRTSSNSFFCPNLFFIL